jgi:hypothetical protein
MAEPGSSHLFRCAFVARGESASLENVVAARHFADDLTDNREQNQAAEAALFLLFSRKIRIAPGLDSVQPGFSGSDPDRFLDVGDEYLAVSDAAGLGGAPDRVDRLLDQVIPDHDLDFHLWQEVDDIFRTAIEFSVSLLAAEALGFGNGDTLQSDFLKRLFHLVELEWLDDGFDLLHWAPPGQFKIAECSRYNVARGAVWFNPCIGQGTRLLIIAADCDDRELGFLTGFLKSRVYAKLSGRLILKCYQTSNGHRQGFDAISR